MGGREMRRPEVSGVGARSVCMGSTGRMSGVAVWGEARRSRCSNIGSEARSVSASPDGETGM